jgi:hypothetical protein
MPEGTHLTASIELDVSGIMSLAEPLVSRALSRDVVGNLARLKSILESRPATASAGTIGAGQL